MLTSSKANQKRRSSELISFELTKNSYFNEVNAEDDLVYSDREDDTKENFRNLKTIAVCEMQHSPSRKKVVIFKSITFRLGRGQYDIRALREEFRR
jgi:hypothetical protein